MQLLLNSTSNSQGVVSFAGFCGSFTDGECRVKPIKKKKKAELQKGKWIHRCCRCRWSVLTALLLNKQTNNKNKYKLIFPYK